VSPSGQWAVGAGDLVDPDESDEFFDSDEVGDERSGRLLAEDEGYGPDLEKDEVAEDVGIDGGAPSAEEAAVHIVEP